MITVTDAKQKCQTAAWKHHHKYECELLRKHPGEMPVTVLALYRLLRLDMDEKLGDKGMDIILMLERQFTNHNNAVAEGHIMNAVMDIGNEIKGLRRPLEVVWPLYCIILTNGMNIRPAGAEETDGFTLNLAASMINVRHFLLPVETKRWLTLQ